MGASKVLDPKRIAMAFGLSALRFIVAVCFLSGVSACIRLFGSLSLMLPAPFAIASKRLSVRPGSSKTEPSLRECEVKSVVLVEERSECCETETESAFVVQSDGRRKASKARKMDALSTLGPSSPSLPNLPARAQGLPEWPRKVGNQPFRSNWLRSLSAMAWISQRSASCCGPSHMIATFHESSWGTTEIARSVGHSLMSSISSLMAASSSSRVFAGFFKCPSLFGWRNGTTASGYPRERMF